jgi:cobalt-zinc-cadmium resistance protein CzcA
MNTNDLLEGIASDVALHIYGPDLPVLQRTAEQVVRALRQVDGAQDVRAEQNAGAHILSVQVDRAAVARHGLDVRSVLHAVTAMGGNVAGTVIDGVRRYPILVRLGLSDPVTPEAIARVPVRTATGNVVPLGQLARVELGAGPSGIMRERLERRITVQANIRGRDVGSFVEDAKRVLDREVELPSGYSTAWAGEYEKLQAASKRLLVLLPMTMALIFVLLLATFGRLRPALFIFANAPMALSGGVFALALRGMDFSVSAGVGFIAVLGVAVLNGLVLVTEVERSLGEGIDLHRALVHACEHRMRPVLTTALVASLGFVPMMLSTGAGAEVQTPLATVVVGGVISSTLLTLLVIPAVYKAFVRSPGVSNAARIAPMTPSAISGEV